MEHLITELVKGGHKESQIILLPAKHTLPILGILLGSNPLRRAGSAFIMVGFFFHFFRASLTSRFPENAQWFLVLRYLSIYNNTPYICSINF